VRTLHQTLAAARDLLNSQLKLARRMCAWDLLSDRTAAALIADCDQLDAFLIDEWPSSTHRRHPERASWRSASGSRNSEITRDVQ
jgi:hypothetical protein